MVPNCGTTGTGTGTGLMGLVPAVPKIGIKVGLVPMYQSQNLPYFWDLESGTVGPVPVLVLVPLLFSKSGTSPFLTLGPQSQSSFRPGTTVPILF